MALNKSNYINKKFNNLTILEFVDAPSNTKNKAAKYQNWVKCKCDCGNIKITNLLSIQSNNTKSCGCRRHRSGKNSPYFEGYEEISGKFFSHIKRTAAGGTNKHKRLCKNFELTIEFLWQLFIKQNRKCALSGLDIKFHSNHLFQDGNASLDRINSTKGYTEDNVQWVHKTINMMKNKLSESEFITLCHKISHYQTKKNY
jgi:hypothetical protein